MFFRILLIFMVSLMILSGCTENNTTNIVGFVRTLVIIGDDAPETELMVGIIGAVKEKYPNVDIQHFRNKNFDIFESGFLLEVAAQSFPENTVFAVIVDPGVGTPKIAFSAGKRRVLAADNGAFTKMSKVFPPDVIHFVNNMSIFDGNYQKTTDVPYAQFYRDAVLHLLSDSPVSSFGTICSEPVKLDVNEASNVSGIVTGQILFTDNFGNCETNVPSTLMSGFNLGDLLEFNIGDNKFFAKFGTHFSSVELNENVAFINSKGKIQISVNYGSLRDRYNLKAGDIFTIKKGKILAGILRYNSSELVDNIIAGMKSELTAKGFIEGKDIEYIERNALGDNLKFPDLISDMVSENIDIMIPISTPAAKAGAQFTPVNTPVIYTYVTSPEFAGLIGKRVNLTGLSDATNFDDYLKFAKELVPNLKIAGRIYNPNEPNSAFSQDRFITLGGFYGISYDNEQVQNEGEISQAFNSLNTNGIKTILIAADNTLNLGFKDLATLSKSNSIVLIGDSEENVTDGALASISVDYDLLSKQTGSTVGNILLGQHADNIPIQRFPTSVITLNQVTATAIGFTFSESLKARAHKIIQ